MDPQFDLHETTVAFNALAVDGKRYRYLALHTEQRDDDDDLTRDLIFAGLILLMNYTLRTPHRFRTGLLRIAP